MDRGEYHQKKRELKIKHRIAAMGLVLGLIFCWTGVGLLLMYPCMKTMRRTKRKRDELEREFEQYESDLNIPEPVED